METEAENLSELIDKIKTVIQQLDESEENQPESDTKEKAKTFGWTEEDQAKWTQFTKSNRDFCVLLYDLFNSRNDKANPIDLLITKLLLLAPSDYHEFLLKRFKVQFDVWTSEFIEAAQERIEKSKKKAAAYN